MNLENVLLPTPPKFNDSDLTVPAFFHCNHPYTKWMLNMIRGGASFRISTMIKERPELFQQIYQIPDCPDLVCNESHDTISMFNRHTILFLNPLCLAIYMKKDKSAELILKSGLNGSNQNCWACEVFSRSQNSRGDLMEIYPICIAIRREYFEVIPILVHCEPRSDFSPVKKLDITKRIEIRYENGEGRKIFRYKDALQYAIDTLKKRGNLPLSRLLEMFILDCPHLFNPYKLEENKNGNPCSLFYRIAKVAFYEDPDCRISMQLIQCLEVLLKHRCVPWNSSFFDSKVAHFLTNQDSILTRDHCSCIGFLLAIYNQIQKRIKNGPLDNLGYLIIKTLQQTHLVNEFLQMNPEQIQMRFGRISPDMMVPIETASFVKRHIQAISELEKEREFKSNLFSKSRGSAFMKRYHRRSCSLVEPSEHSANQNLLQSRLNQTNSLAPELTNSQAFLKPLRNHLENLKSDELIPLYIYQTGVNTNDTQKDFETPHLLRNAVLSHEEQTQSPLRSEVCEKLEIIKHSIIPELYKKSNLKPNDRLSHKIEKSPLKDHSEHSDTNSGTNCLEMSSIKSCRYPIFTEHGDGMPILKHQFIPTISKRNRSDLKAIRFDNSPINYTAVPDSDNVINYLEMTPIKSCHQIMNDIQFYPPIRSRLHSSRDIHAKPVSFKSSNNSNNFNSDGLIHNKKINDHFPANYFDDFDLTDDFSMLGRVDELDLCGELTDNERLMEYEDDLLDELFIEYNGLLGRYHNEEVVYSRNQLQTIDDRPFISKRNNRKLVNNSLYHLSSDDNFVTL